MKIRAAVLRAGFVLASLALVALEAAPRLRL
jgi:hypothetical protein